MDDRLTQTTADIVSAYVTNNTVASTELIRLIANVHQALAGIEKGKTPTPAPEPQMPAVPIRKSITPDFIICLEDGEKFKSLKRHLSATYQMTPDEYRAKWDLPSDYPMVAPNYARHRSQLARQTGLGRRRIAQR